MRSKSLGHSATVLAALAILLGNFAFAVTAVHRRASSFRLAPAGTVSDLHFRWLGTRQLLFDGVNPYTPAAAREGERGYYGRPLTEREKSLDPENYLGFNYPLHVAVLLAPLALLPFPIVQVLATIGLAALLAWATMAWCRALGWPATRGGRLIACVAAITSLPALDLLSLQQPTGFVAGLVVLAVVSLARDGRPAVAGVCMACATIKPQLVALPIVAAILWALVRPRDRWPFLAGLGATLVLLVGASLALLPTWPAWFLSNLRAYAAQVPASSLLGRLPAWPRATVDALVVVLTLGMLSRRDATREGHEQMLLDVFALSLAATLVVSVADHLYDRVFLVPPLLCLARLHGSSRAIARLSPAGICLRLVAATLALVLVGGAIDGLLLRVGMLRLVPALTRVTTFGYAVLPLGVWTALLLAIGKRAGTPASPAGQAPDVEDARRPVRVGVPLR